MITTGLTNNDLKIMEMDLDELKDYRNRIVEETLELETVLGALAKDPKVGFSETTRLFDAYSRKWKPEGFVR